MHRMPAVLHLGRVCAARSSKARTSASVTPGRKDAAAWSTGRRALTWAGLQIMARTLRPHPGG